MAHKIIKDWITEAGLRAAASISDMGTINGYVEVPSYSLYSGMEYKLY